MSEIKQCDGCGKHSPDEKGLHVANNWYHIEYSYRGHFGMNHEKKDLCIACFDKARNALKSTNEDEEDK